MKTNRNLLGWCMTGHHAGVIHRHGIPCPGHVVVKGTGVEHICTCWCHEGAHADPTTMRPSES